MAPIRATTIEEAVARAADALARPVVVVVDDDPRRRAQVAAWVEGAGYEAAPAASDAAGLARLARRSPAALVLDLDLGGAGGPATLDLIRTADPGVPVVAVASARGRAADLLLHGADAFVVKPVERDALTRALAAALRSAPLPRPRPPPSLPRARAAPSAPGRTGA